LIRPRHQPVGPNIAQMQEVLGRLRTYLGVGAMLPRSSGGARSARPGRDTTVREAICGLLVGLVLCAVSVALLSRTSWHWRLLGSFDLIVLGLPQVFRSSRCLLRRAASKHAGTRP
jgi:hypothetical protein